MCALLPTTTPLGSISVAEVTMQFNCVCFLCVNNESLFSNVGHYLSIAYKTSEFHSEESMNRKPVRYKSLYTMYFKHV
jgi:hypothetical protein